MSIAIKTPATWAGDSASVAETINRYLHLTLGNGYTTGKGHLLPNGDWRFLIMFHATVLKRPLTCAVIHVNGQTGKVTPLTSEQIQEARERALIATAEANNKNPMINGIVPRILARRAANPYLNDAVGFYFLPIDGTFIMSQPPMWQFPIQFRLPRSGDLGILGTIDVDALSGTVIPLAADEIIKLQSNANALAGCQTSSPTA